MEKILVSKASNPKAVAGAIAAIIRKGDNAVVSAIGAQAVNQAVKSIIVSRDYLTQDSIDIVCIPTFYKDETEEMTKTSVHFSVEKRT